MNSDGILSGPGAILSFNIVSTFSTSSSVTHPSKEGFFTHRIAKGSDSVQSGGARRPRKCFPRSSALTSIYFTNEFPMSFLLVLQYALLSVKESIDLARLM